MALGNCAPADTQRTKIIAAAKYTEYPRKFRAFNPVIAIAIHNALGCNWEKDIHQYTHIRNTQGAASLNRHASEISAAL